MTWLPELETAVLTFIVVLLLFYAWVAVALAWSSRPPVVWDYECQAWRSARLVRAERARGGRRCP